MEKSAQNVKKIDVVVEFVVPSTELPKNAIETNLLPRPGARLADK